LDALSPAGCKPPLKGRGVRSQFEHDFIATALGNDSFPAATVSIKDDAVVDDLRLRQTVCILHHMQGIRTHRYCRVNAPVGRLGPCSDANQDQSSYEQADLTHLNSPVDMDAPPIRCASQPKPHRYRRNVSCRRFGIVCIAPAQSVLFGFQLVQKG